MNGREYRAKYFEDGLSALSLFFRKIISGCNPLYTMGSMEKKKKKREGSTCYLSWYSLCFTRGLKRRIEWKYAHSSSYIVMCKRMDK